MSPPARPLFKAPPIVGDIAPPCVLPGIDRNPVDLNGDAVAGHPVVVLFCPSFGMPPIAEMLAGFKVAATDFAALGAPLFVVTRENTRAAMEQGLPFPALMDKEGEAFAAFGASRGGPTVFVLRPNYHVKAILKDGAAAAAALSLVKEMVAERHVEVMGRHAPVLIVPEVFSREDCAYFVRVFAERGKTFIEPGHGDDHMTTDYKMRIPEYGRGDRIDHWILDKDTVTLADARLKNRVFPEIRKAFHYQVTKRERLRMGSYAGDRGGELHGHRDNSEPVSAYRRFAMTINLNTEDYEGGALRFLEYGDQLYRPRTGDAIVFSSSILHEATEVTKGKRLALLAFLYGES